MNKNSEETILANGRKKEAHSYMINYAKYMKAHMPIPSAIYQDIKSEEYRTIIEDGNSASAYEFCNGKYIPITVPLDYINDEKWVSDERRDYWYVQELLFNAHYETKYGGNYTKETEKICHKINASYKIIASDEAWQFLIGANRPMPIEDIFPQILWEADLWEKLSDEIDYLLYAVKVYSPDENNFMWVIFAGEKDEYGKGTWIFAVNDCEIHTELKKLSAKSARLLGKNLACSLSNIEEFCKTENFDGNFEILDSTYYPIVKVNAEDFHFLWIDTKYPQPYRSAAHGYITEANGDLRGVDIFKNKDGYLTYKFSGKE